MNEKTITAPPKGVLRVEFPRHYTLLRAMHDAGILHYYRPQILIMEAR